jgi:hypothetical protein
LGNAFARRAAVQHRRTSLSNQARESTPHPLDSPSSRALMSHHCGLPARLRIATPGTLRKQKAATKSNKRQARRRAMMREVTGAFCGARRLDEALNDLRAEGITGDRVRITDISSLSDTHIFLERSASSPTQWITAEYAGLNEPMGFAVDHVVSMGIEASDDDILPDFDRDLAEVDESIESFHTLTRVIVSIRDEAEMRAVCDIFSRLGTDDIDAESVAA